LALLVNLVCTLPVLVWNQQHDWITATHLEQRGGLTSAWHPTLRFFWDFLVTVPLLMNPVFFTAMVWACVAFWDTPNGPEIDGERSSPTKQPSKMLPRYLFCLGAPVFLFYLSYTFRARVQPNWVAPGILPLFLAAAVIWSARSRSGSKLPRWFLVLGISIGLPVAVLLHDTRLVGKVTGWQLPRRMDPMNRVRGYHQLAPQVAEQRAKLEKSDGKPVFIIADHYGRAGLLSFYIPEAKAAVGTARPLVTVRATEKPENQFWFWPEYRYDDRRGENAIYVIETDDKLPTPPELLTEFQTVTDLGMFDDEPDPKRAWRHFQLFACRGKR
jgi:hypothetical protein